MTKVKTEYRDRSIGEWLDMMHKSQIALPIFQRGKKWDSKKKARLLEAVLDGRPVGIPTILACEKGKMTIKVRSFNDKEKREHAI